MSMLSLWVIFCIFVHFFVRWYRKSRRMNKDNINLTSLWVIIATALVREKACKGWYPSVCRITQTDWSSLLNMRANSRSCWGEMWHLCSNIWPRRMNRQILSTVSNRIQMVIYANQHFVRRRMMLVFELCSFVICTVQFHARINEREECMKEWKTRENNFHPT